MSYKLPLLKALPNEVKYLTAYASLMGAKLMVDDPDSIRFIKEYMTEITQVEGEFVTKKMIQQVTNIFYPEDEGAKPPDGIFPFENSLGVPTEDNLDSKKAGVLQIYQWSQKLNQNLYQLVNLVKVPEDAPPEEQTTEAWLSKI